MFARTLPVLVGVTTRTMMHSSSSSLVLLVTLLSVTMTMLSGVAEAQTWVKEPSLLVTRSDFVAATVGEYTYLAGGCSGNQAVDGNCPAYTAAHNRFHHPTKSFNTLANLPRSRYRYAVAVVDSKIYFIGGRTIPADDPILEIDVFDTTTQTYSQLPTQTATLPTSDAAAFVIGKKIYLTGGYSGDYSVSYASTWVLDTADGTGLFRAGLVPDRYIGAGDLGAITINGKGYVFGGFNAGDFCNPLGVLSVYDPSTNTWSNKTNMPSPCGDMAYTTVYGWLFVMGGETKNSFCNYSVPIGAVQRFDPVTNKWTVVAPIAENRFRFTGTSYGTSIFDIGGQGAKANVSAGGTEVFPILSDVYALDVSYLWVVTPVDPWSSAATVSVSAWFTVAASVVLAMMSRSFLF